MQTVIMYYSFGGFSRKEAEKLAVASQGATLFEVKEKKKRGKISAFLKGCPMALKREASEINEITCDLQEAEHIVLVAPVWAGFPVPAFNAMVSRIPSGKNIEVYLCSAGGETPKSKEGTIEMLESKGHKVVAYHDVKSAPSN